MTSNVPGTWSLTVVDMARSVAVVCVGGSTAVMGSVTVNRSVSGLPACRISPRASA